MKKKNDKSNENGEPHGISNLVFVRSDTSEMGRAMHAIESIDSTAAAAAAERINRYVWIFQSIELCEQHEFIDNVLLHQFVWVPKIHSNEYLQINLSVNCKTVCIDCPFDGASSVSHLLHKSEFCIEWQNAISDQVI